MRYDQAQLSPARKPSARNSPVAGEDFAWRQNSPAALFQELERISPFPSFLLVEFLSPLVGFFLVASGLIKLHQPLQGFGNARLAGSGDLGRALLQALVALQ